MTYLCVSIPIEETHVEEALAQARQSAEAGADLVEWRIDHIAHLPKIVDHVVQRSPLPCIVTCRPEWEGGDYDGDEVRRIDLLRAIAGAEHARYIDLELAACDGRSIMLRDEISRSTADLATRLIISFHDSAGRPTDLYRRIRAMSDEPAASVIKVAWRARSLRDNLQAFDLLRDRPKPMIAICMGEFGVMSRILAPKFGGFLTFASANEGVVTAPGQPSIHEFVERYRFRSITSDTKVYGLIGWPVRHSISPDLHNAAFNASGFNGVYVPMPIGPDYESFKATLCALLDDQNLDFRGASITLPHKEHVLRFVDDFRDDSPWRFDVDALTREIGAANTISISDNGIHMIRNTDADALVDSLCAALAIDRSALVDRRIGIIGAGGVARAAVAALSRLGATIVLYDRSPDRAAALAEEFGQLRTREGNPRKVVASRLDKLCDSCCEVFINCTPVGMKDGPAPDASPVVFPPDGRPRWNTETLIFDTVYTPKQTPLLSQAEAAGCRTLNGLDMLCRQAAAQFHLWTGAIVRLGEWIQRAERAFTSSR